MNEYYISLEAEEDLIRIHNYGSMRFGKRQADLYFDKFFIHFDIINRNPAAFEAVDFLKPGYRRCPCGTDSIFYRITDERVEIIRIIGQQELNRIFIIP